MKLFKMLDGWKSILGYVIAQVSGSQPLFMAAWLAWLAAPKDPQAIANLLGQAILAGGLIARLVKNLLKKAK